MKRILLATLSMTLLSAPAFSETISVICQCTFTFDSSMKSIVSYGEKTDATKLDVENCVFEDGKISPGTCWSAKGDALINCAKEAKTFSSDQLYIPAVTIEEDACFGKVEND